MPEAQTTNPPTFESFMAELQETARQQKEDREHLKETERIM